MNKTKEKYTLSVDCKYNQDVIELSVVMRGKEELATISREIVRLKEDSIKKALIDLGWTPPGGDA